MTENKNLPDARELFESLPPESKLAALAAVETVCRAFIFSIELQTMLNRKERNHEK